ncbi:glutathione S-transferase C-terminal domain-containing protein homolog [Lepeophtheirus salmonis]|uniref:glutathione S-transferase C-terminal domain-containing protein homolog n=1 Tax=Lepeophtheirus salmonis TaxID=72036 RepID=UPI001AE5EF9C|nr:glutathione S-transferase C-terminal domain-containing protein homolog [Lepeophtheirus salmonis]
MNVDEMVLYLEKSSSNPVTDEDGTFKGLSLNSFICLYVLEYLGILTKSSNRCLKICFLHTKNQRQLKTEFAGTKDSSKDSYDIKLSNYKCKIVVDTKKSVCVALPALHTPQNNYYVGGLCAVLRYIISEWDLSKEFKGILGHNSGNLSSPAEVSTWTRFVEIDLPSVVLSPVDLIDVPQHLARFEIHMKQPIKVHNIRKRIKSVDINTKDDDAEDPIIEYARNNHKYCEGPDLLLSDLIVYPMMYLIFDEYPMSLANSIPTVHHWFIKSMGRYATLMFNKIFLSPDAIQTEIGNISLDGSSTNLLKFPQDMDLNASFYKSDSKQSTSNARVYTKQSDIDNVLAILENGKLREKVLQKTILNLEPIDWSSVPEEIHPKGGGLPPHRIEKKCQQLECLYTAVKGLHPKKGDIIVDFCCGAGHLALVLAHFLPQCEIYLVENKAESIRRAKDRAQNLKNVTFFQCNMDYFKGGFNIGVSLHACGVATDLVISRCLSEKAKFVSCPCCYGSVSDNHILEYPRSNAFKEVIKSEEYYILCHAADQVHPEGSDNSIEKSIQGRKAMQFVDSDRLLEASELNYKVVLSRLYPESCTPKNNLLIGDFL